jgi:4-deoxy-L-threo-5-hexosulose-uronate ketol-isomerase
MSDSHLTYTIRHAVDPVAAAMMDTETLRENFHLGDLFQPGRIALTYTHYDRMIVGGAVPTGAELALTAIKPTGTGSFLERRELVAFNIGGPGKAIVDGTAHALATRDMIYVGRGAQVAFASDDAANPAKFYLLSAPAHATHPTSVVRPGDANQLNPGSPETANKRTVYQYIHPNGIKTCQLVVGMTELAPGSVWNTMPSHVHDRRMEVYLYFDLPETSRVFHLLGEPQETRHIVMASEEAVLSPPWSIHSGCGTSAYAFIWAMAGDNVDYTDMDPAPLEQMR